MKGVMSVEPTDDGGFTLEVNRSDGVDVTAVVALTMAGRSATPSRSTAARRRSTAISSRASTWRRGSGAPPNTCPVRS